MSGKKKDIPWRNVGFDGLSFMAPPVWDLVEIEYDKAKGWTYRFDEEGEMRVMGRAAHSSSGKVNLAKSAGRALAKLGKQLRSKQKLDFAPEEIKPVKLGPIDKRIEAVLTQWSAGRFRGHILAFQDNNSGTAHMLSFHWSPERSDEEIFNTMVKFGDSLRLGPGSNGLFDWQLGGIRIPLEPEWRIDKMQVAACKTILVFRHSRQKSRVLHVARWGMAALRLTGLLLELWPMRYFRRQGYLFRVDADLADRTEISPDSILLHVRGYPFSLLNKVMRVARRFFRPFTGEYLSGYMQHDVSENAVLMLVSQSHETMDDDEAAEWFKRLELKVMHPRPTLPKVRHVHLEVDDKGKPIITPEVQLASIPTPNGLVELKHEGETIWYLEAPAKLDWRVKTLRFLSGQGREKKHPLRLQLDDAGLFVWKNIDGRKRMDQLVVEFAKHFRLDYYEARRAIWEFMKSLVKRNLCGIVIPSDKK